MAIKELSRTIKLNPSQEKELNKFIGKGGSLAVDKDINESDYHRLSLKMPKWMLDKIDAKRKERVGTVSRNLWILEQLQKLL